jgi:outer membrane protein OmpA-like peptidoglycan-associated protein
MTRRHFVGGLVALGVLATALTGCDSQPLQSLPVQTSCPGGGNAPLTLVVGARADSPRPAIPSQVHALIQDAAVGGQLIQVIRVDGQPTTALTATFATQGQNPQIRNEQLQGFVSKAESAITNLQPKAPQADVLGALSLAARTTPAGGTIVLIDSGLPTTGPLSYQDTSMFGAAPADVTAFLQSQNLMPDLSGRSVLLVNLGDTAAPEPQLPPNLVTQISGLWTAVVTKAQAKCVGTVSVASSRTSVTTAVPVTVVPLPKPPVFPLCGTTVLSDSGAVGFVVGTAKFRDADAVTATLHSLAQILTGHNQQVTLTGSTSSEGNANTNLMLSRNRADAVKQVLVGLGIDASRIATAGVGSGGPNHVTDMTPAGVLIPAAAEQNRSVTVTLVCQN